MKKYSLGFLQKLMTFFVFAVITIAIPLFALHLVAQILSGQGLGNDGFILIALWLLIAGFWVYLLITIIAICKHKYKSIAVNHDEKKLVFFDSKNQVNIIPFDAVEHIEISKGEIVRGIPIGQIRIFVKPNQVLKVILSGADELYCAIAKDFSINMQESIFFRAK